jgi:hypothetical protein
MRYEVKSLSTAKNRIAVLSDVAPQYREKLKKLLAPSVAIVATVVFAGAARADVITSVSVNTSYAQPIFGPNPYTTPPANYTAGAEYVDDWNSFNADIPGGSRDSSPVAVGATEGTMQTSTGGTSPIGFSVDYENADNTGATANNITPQHLYYEDTGGANDLVLNGGIQNGSAPLTLALTGLSATDSYNVYVYASSLYFSQSASIAVSDSLQTYYLASTASNGLSSFTQATTVTAPTTMSPTPAANYVEFTGITNLAALTITLTNADGAGDSPALTAFQVDDLGSSVPEPASIGLLGALGAGLLLRRRALITK